MPISRIVNDDGESIVETEDDNISDGQKTIKVINLLYGHNGSNWERVATDGSGNLKIVLS